MWEMKCEESVGRGDRRYQRCGEEAKGLAANLARGQGGWGGRKCELGKGSGRGGQGSDYRCCGEGGGGAGHGESVGRGWGKVWAKGETLKVGGGQKYEMKCGARRPGGTGTVGEES